MSLLAPAVSSISDGRDASRVLLTSTILEMKWRAKSLLWGAVTTFAALGMSFDMALGPAAAQPPTGNSPSAATATSVGIPGFWDPRRRPERPDLSRVTLIRFISEID